MTWLAAVAALKAAADAREGVDQPLHTEGRDPAPAFLTHFGVRPDHQRRGLGRCLLTRAVRDLAAQARGPIRLEVATDSPRSRPLPSLRLREINAYAYHEVVIPTVAEELQLKPGPR